MVLEKVCEYLYYNEKHKNTKDVQDMEIPPELCLELLMAADFLQGDQTSVSLRTVLTFDQCNDALDNSFHEIRFIDKIPRRFCRCRRRHFRSKFCQHSPSYAMTRVSLLFTLDLRTITSIYVLTPFLYGPNVYS